MKPALAPIWIALALAFGCGRGQEPLPTLDISLDVTSLSLPAGTTRTLIVKVHGAGAISIVGVGLPSGVTADSLSIDAGDSVGVLRLTAALSAPTSAPATHAAI